MSAAAVGKLFTFYKRAISPALHSVSVGGACRFQPTCSEYATLAVANHGMLRGCLLALGRILRCHPGCRGGFDPVPGTWPTLSSQPSVQSSGAAVTIEEPCSAAIQPPSHDCQT